MERAKQFFLLMQKNIITENYNCGSGKGVRAVYSQFFIDENPLKFKIDTLVWIDDYKGGFAILNLMFLMMNGAHRANTLATKYCL